MYCPGFHLLYLTVIACLINKSTNTAMRSWGDEKKATPSNTDLGACVANTAFLSWCSSNIIQLLRGAELERCNYFWKKGTSELWSLWYTLIATQSMKTVCLSQYSVYLERFAKETSFTDGPVGGWLSIIARGRWREMSSPVSALLMRMDSNLCLCSPAEMKCHLNHSCTEMSKGFSSYFLPFKYSTTFRNQKPALTMDLQPEFLIASQAPTVAFTFVSYKTYPGECKGSNTCSEIHWNGKGNL